MKHFDCRNKEMFDFINSYLIVCLKPKDLLYFSNKNQNFQGQFNKIKWPNLFIYNGNQFITRNRGLQIRTSMSVILRRIRVSSEECSKSYLKPPRKQLKANCPNFDT